MAVHKSTRFLSLPQERSSLTAELIYTNYAFNRRQSPDITPEQWKLVFGPAVEEMEARFQAERKAAVIQFPRVPFVHQRNYDIRCETIDVTFGTTGEDGMPCGKPTLRCPGCDGWSELCEDHLFVQPNGMSVCADCDGDERFWRKPAESVSVIAVKAVL